MNNYIKLAAFILFSSFFFVMPVFIVSNQASILKLLKDNEINQKQLDLNTDLATRKIDDLQDKIYQDRANQFFQNNNIHYSSRLSGGELIQINYEDYVKDYHNGFNSTAIYNLSVCYLNTKSCLKTKEERRPTISFKNTEVITNYSVEKIKPTLAEYPIYVIKIETNLLNHLYFFVSEFDDSSAELYYRLINPITDQGWLRQYEGEKKITSVSLGKQDLTIELEIIPKQYQVQKEIYIVEMKLGTNGAYRLEYKSK